MVKTRSSISPSASSKAMNPKNKSKETMSEGSDSGESALSSKRKRNNVGSKKGKHADRPLKKMKQVIDEEDVEYDSDDLEIGVPDSIKEWEQYFKPESRVKGKMIFFPNTLENKVIANINAKLSPEQIRLFRKSCFGHLLDMKPILYQPQLIHNALLREVHQKNEKEMWFKFGCENFRFSLAEFAVITGLLCNGDNDMKKYAKRENAFVDKYFFEQQVTHGAVEQRFMFSEFKSDEYAVKMAILYLLTNGLICSPAVKKVSDELMNIVGLGEYDSFPWGKIVFDLTLHNLMIALRGRKRTDLSDDSCGKGKAKVKRKQTKENSKTYKLPGFPYAFMVWLYETIPLCLKASICQYDASQEYRICRWSSTGNPNSGELDRKIFMSSKLKAQAILPTDVERKMMKLEGFDFPVLETSEDDFDDEPLQRKHYEKGDPSGIQRSYGVGKSDLVELKNNVKMLVGNQTKFDESLSLLSTEMKCSVKECELNMKSYIDAKIDGSLKFYLDMKFNELRNCFLSGNDGGNVVVSDEDTFNMNDDDLVLTNEEEPVVEVEKAGDEMLVDNKVEEVLDVTNIENKNDGGSQPTFDIMCFITSQPGDEKGDDDKKEVVDDDHEMFKNGSNKLREDDNDGDDKGIGGDGVGAKEVKGGGNVGGSSGGVSAGESAIKEGKEVVSVNEKVADDEMIYEETKEFTGATEKLGDSQGTEDSITLSALEKINDIEETIAKGKVLHKEVMASNQRNIAKDLNVEFTPKVVKRAAKPASVMKSPYTTNFGSASSGKPTGEVYGLFPFSNGLMAMPDELQVKSFEQWFKAGFNDKNKLKKFKQEDRVLKVPLDFVVVKVNDKMWFYDLRTPGRNLSCSHIDVCFYYLRKQIKYDKSVRVAASTTDCFFAAHIFDLYNKFCANDEDINSVPRDTKAAAYIAGFGLLCGKPWFVLDFMLFPVNVMALAHWILCVFDIKMRCLKVCNSLRRGKFKDSRSFVNAFAVILPILLSHVDFYGRRSDIDKSTQYFQGVKDTDPLEIVFIDKLPQQDQCDCGVFVIKYAEYFIHEMINNVPKTLNMDFVRKKMCVELFVHAMKKELNGYESGSEFTGKMPKATRGALKIG
ncbi:hypothetical protein CsatA_025171 [Cannabis sativa]